MDYLKNAIFSFIAFCLVLIFSFACLEIPSYFVYKHRYREDEKNLFYEHDPFLGWFPEKNSRRSFKAAQQTLVIHNSRGFRDREFVDTGKPVVAFIGDSFTWGFDVDQNNRFTDILRKKMPGFNVVNLGVSAYSTDQEYLLLRREFNFYKPSIVVLMFCGNDREGNSSNKAYGYYKPYFKYSGSKLTVNGIPVSKNAMYAFKSSRLFYKPYFLLFFLKLYDKLFSEKEIWVADPTSRIITDMDIFSRQRNAAFIVALIDKDTELKRFCADHHIKIIDLSSVGEGLRFTYGGGHWNERGHQAVADLVYNYFSKWTAGVQTARAA